MSFPETEEGNEGRQSCLAMHLCSLLSNVGLQEADDRPCGGPAWDLGRKVSEIEIRTGAALTM